MRNSALSNGEVSNWALNEVGSWPLAVNGMRHSTSATGESRRGVPSPPVRRSFACPVNCFTLAFRRTVYRFRSKPTRGTPGEASREDAFCARSAFRRYRPLGRTPGFRCEADQEYRGPPRSVICAGQSNLPRARLRFWSAESFWILRLAGAPASNLGLDPALPSAGSGPSLGGFIRSLSSFARRPIEHRHCRPSISCSDRPATPCRSAISGAAKDSVAIWTGEGWVGHWYLESVILPTDGLRHSSE
jgi:hypothetical protein